MNVFEKVQKIKLELLDCHLKKSGNNKFANFKYYELDDFMPHIIRLCDKYKIFTQITFDENYANLFVFDSENKEDLEKPPKITIKCPIEKLEIRGANAIQAIGGMQTYLRRYLYMALFEITENDLFDANHGKSEITKTKKIEELGNKSLSKKQGISTEEKDELRTLIGNKDLELKLLKQYKVNYLVELTPDQAKEIKERIEKFKAKTEKKQEENNV
ncbi:MAG: ERF family protein [Candidatus Improbicoccus devescovinae]|nr:MAG: ERF family protein [Candidatus Improbicoccus devescovinae]GMB10612.1 MAG: ERF family protein [Candidatus Improbicoccus devescovinae]